MPFDHRKFHGLRKIDRYTHDDAEFKNTYILEDYEHAVKTFDSSMKVLRKIESEFKKEAEKQQKLQLKKYCKPYTKHGRIIDKFPTMATDIRRKNKEIFDKKENLKVLQDQKKHLIESIKKKSETVGRMVDQAGKAKYSDTNERIDMLLSALEVMQKKNKPPGS
ncbi:MAG: hypothetical protein HQL69_18480 [Magnetococcales bacterium]|nr:hypothetical protein [Magnetococcales bacterium]